MTIRIGLIGALCPLLVLLAGCGPQQRSKGAGASGKALKVEANPDLGLELINQLDGQQQKAYDFLRQPFDKAVTLPENPDPETQKVLDYLKEDWDDVPFADNQKGPNGTRYMHMAQIETTAGMINMELTRMANNAPNLIRCFIILARRGFFDGRPITLAKEFLHIGGDDAPELFHVDAYTWDVPVRGGVLFAAAADGKCSPTRLLLSYKDALEPDATKALAGGTLGAGDNQLLEEIAQQLVKDPTSVTIKSITIITRENALFRIEQGPLLPKLNPDGKPAPPMIQ